MTNLKFGGEFLSCAVITHIPNQLTAFDVKAKVRTRLRRHGPHRPLRLSQHGARTEAELATPTQADRTLNDVGRLEQQRVAIKTR